MSSGTAGLPALALGVGKVWRRAGTKLCPNTQRVLAGQRRTMVSAACSLLLAFAAPHPRHEPRAPPPQPRPPPPPTSRSAVHHFHERGFLVLRDALQTSEIMKLATTVGEYIRSTGPLLRPHALADVGGWFVADYPSDPAFAYFFDVVQNSKKLRQALTDVLGSGYRSISRNEIYISTAAAWHIDWMYGPLARYTSDHARPSLHPQATLPNNATMRIATIAIYLQSHAAADNTNALTVRPGLHRCAIHDPHQRPPAGSRPCTATNVGNGSKAVPRGQEFEETTLHPDVGDVVIFDARLPHRGQDRQYADAVRDASLPMLITGGATGHRAMLSMQFGADNAFSERMDRAFTLRNAVYNNASVCGMPLTTNRVLNSTSQRQIAAAFSAPCITRAVNEDLRRRPLAPLV